MLQYNPLTSNPWTTLLPFTVVNPPVTARKFGARGQSQASLRSSGSKVQTMKGS